MNFATKILLKITFILLDGWVFMWTVSMIREHWIAQVPTLGYWWATAFVFLLQSCFTPSDLSKLDGAK